MATAWADQIDRSSPGSAGYPLTFAMIGEALDPIGKTFDYYNGTEDTVRLMVVPEGNNSTDAIVFNILPGTCGVAWWSVKKILTDGTTVTEGQLTSGDVVINIMSA